MVLFRRRTVFLTPIIRLRSERGQTTLFFITAFWTLFLFLAFVVNLGQAVNRRVKLQMMADAGAWTGAAKQAQVLNSLIQINDAEKNFVFLPTQLMTVDFTVTIEPLGGIADMLWTIGNNIYKIAFKILNMSGNFQAVEAAKTVTVKNIEQLFPQETGSIRYPSIGIPLDMMEVEGVSKGEGENTMYEALYWIGVNDYTVDLSNVWYKAKSGHKIVNFFWWVHADETGGHVLPGVFRIPKMTAVALAKPTGGVLDPEDTTGAHSDGYKVRMIPVNYLKDSDYMGYLQTMATIAELAAADPEAVGKLMIGINTPISTPIEAKIVH
jgi:hypothetical protein